MDVYCVITMISDEKYAEFLENLNIYHGQTFPFCKKDQVYKVINRDMCIVRVGDFWSTGDLLGYLSTEIELSNEDRLYCIPISSNPNGFTSIRHNWTYLEKLDDLDADKEYSSEHFRQARDIFYLVNYLHMLEKDEIEVERVKNEIYVISDRFQHGATSRFCFDELEDWIRPRAKELGFLVILYRDGKKVNEVNKGNFHETELVFVGAGNRNWKEKVGFDIDGKTSARTIQNGNWERITRKP